MTLPLLEVMRIRIRGLVQFVERTGRNPIDTDFEDTLNDPTEIELARVGTSEMNWERFRDKTAAYLKRHEDKIVLQRLKRNKQLTPDDLDELAR